MERFVWVRQRAAITAAAVAIAAAVSGCGQQDVVVDNGAEAEPQEPEIVTLFPDTPPVQGESECKVVITTGIAVAPAKHVATCTPVKYATNPPSGGDHWRIWAAYKAYTTPVPREMYVHDLEHGAIVLAYRCPSGCPETVAMLDAVRTEAASDPRCLTVPGGPQARLVLTPDPLLDAPVAAAAWGATYTATCLDKASLARFVADRYAKGTEDTCAGGTVIDEPDGGAPNCDGDDPDGGAPDGGAPDGGQ
jgi:hypothetical protein